MKYLVTGGAGYIGSFMVKRLIDDGHTVIVLDSLERGQESKIPSTVTLFKGSLLDKDFLSQLFSEHTFDGVFHFAAYISVPESAKKPELYFNNNVVSSLNLINKLVEHNIHSLVFSSTAAVYGTPQIVPIPEDHPKNPESPYGESKLIVESMLHWYSKVHSTKFAALRYFNACGAALDGSMGESHQPETHIIPNAIEATINDEEFVLHGTDYETKDGTCVRDYIHVLDLVESHVKAMNLLQSGHDSFICNIGTGSGYTNKEILNEIEKVSGKKLKISFTDRRAGDPSILTADPTIMKNVLGFEPRYSDIHTIISSAWKWHTNEK